MDLVFAFFFLMVCFLFGSLVANTRRIAKQTENLPGNHTSESVTLANATPASQDWRRDAILEAIRRDPTLAQDTTGDTLARLDVAVEAIEREMVLRDEVEQALRQQQAKKEAEVQAKIDRDLFDAKVAETGNLLLGALFGFPIGGDGNGFRPGNGCFRIVPGSPADRAGLQPGDVLMSMNDTRIRTNDDVKKFMAGASVGDHVLLHIRRGSNKVVLEADL